MPPPVFVWTKTKTLRCVSVVQSCETHLIGPKSGRHPRVLLQRASGIVVGMRVPLLRVARPAAAGRGAGHRRMMMMMMMIVLVSPVMIATARRGHRGGHRRRACSSLRGRRGQQFFVAAQRLVVARWPRRQRRQGGRAPFDAGRRHRRHDRGRSGFADPVRSRGGGRLDGGRPAIVTDAAAVMVVPRAAAVPARLSGKREKQYVYTIRVLISVATRTFVFEHDFLLRTSGTT